MSGISLVPKWACVACQRRGGKRRWEAGLGPPGTPVSLLSSPLVFPATPLASSRLTIINSKRVPSLPMSSITLLAAKSAWWIFFKSYAYASTLANAREIIHGRLNSYAVLFSRRKIHGYMLHFRLQFDTLIWDAKSSASGWIKTILGSTKWNHSLKRPLSASGLLVVGCECTSFASTCMLGESLTRMLNTASPTSDGKWECVSVTMHFLSTDGLYFKCTMNFNKIKAVPQIHTYQALQWSHWEKCQNWL